tara:strand:- start:263 stop:592 length:330 start_codon:yes stop_codon:yes gene_type:complete
MPTMIDAYKSFWTRSFDFKGVTNRPDYWWAYLAYLIVLVFLAILSELADLFSALLVFYVIAGAIPNLSIQIRRVRDMGKGWQWIFINLIPIIGPIWYIVLLCQPSLPIA